MSSKTLSLWALALSAALNSNPILAQQSSASMTQNQIHDRIIELCKSPDSGKNIVNGTKEICDEYSTDGGKTWIKAVGWASILALSLGALVQIRKRKTEKEKIADAEIGDSEFLWTSFGENPEIDLDEETLPPDDEWIQHNDHTIDLVAESEVYFAYWRYEQAIELLQKEMKENPENTNAYLKLAGVYKQMKEAAKAVIDKNPTIKDSGLLKELSNFERSLSESELKKLIETAEIGSVPKNEIIVDELDMNRMDEGFRLSADWGEDFQDTKKYMKMVEFIYKRGSKEQFNQFYETTRKMEVAGFFKLSELELLQIKAWWHELDLKNPIYKEEGLIIEWHITEIDNAPETILPVEQPLLIAHNEPEPSHITPTEDIFPESKPQVQAKFTSKNQWKLWIDKAVIARLDSLGFAIEKSEDGNSATITVLKEWVSLRYIEVGTNEPQSINQGEKYTITNATGIFYTNRSGDPTLMVRQRSGKDRYIQIIIEKK